VEELLKAALISSGNDASYLLAQFLGGTEYAFVQRMNRRAAQLGMKHTFYSNSTGMPAPKSINDNRSSPSDLLILAREMLNYDQLLDMAGTSNTVITQDKRVIRLRNHNGLVATYSDVDGLKTGFTKNAKYCLVATANKSGRRLIAIALGVSDWKTRNQFVASTISRYYETLGIGGLEPKTMYAAANCNKKKSSSKSASKKAYVSGVNAGESGLHRVKKGETLHKISKKYGCSVAELKSWNLLRGSIINPGQQLIVRGDFQADSQTSRLRIISFYKVRPGDTLWNISQKYEGISVKDIMKVNQIRRARDLKAGTTLKIARHV
jgi:D-alanyl-D-alanine carboxypeptidase